MKTKSLCLSLVFYFILCFSYAYRTIPNVSYQTVNGTSYKMDCYIPNSFYGCPNPNSNDPNFYVCGPSNATIIVLMHGGFFEFGDKSEMINYAKAFASQENLIVLNIDYRLGWGFNQSSPCSGNPQSLISAGYKVLQDANSAINYFINNANNTAFQIDNPKRYTWNVFAGGFSSGAVTSLNLHALQSEIDTYYPGLSASEGAVNAQPGLYQFKGSLSIGGGMSHLDGLKEGTYNVFYHGDSDPIMPYNYGFPVNTACSNYEPTYGGRGIFDYITSECNTNGKKINAKLYTAMNGGHLSFYSKNDMNIINFVVATFLDNIDQACIIGGCGTIPSGISDSGPDCEGVVPYSNQINIAIPSTVIEEVMACSPCYYYAIANPEGGGGKRIAKIPETETAKNINAFIQLNTTKQMNIYSLDGIKLYSGKISNDEVFPKINEMENNHVLVVELIADGGKVQKFKYLK
jgi:Carboxylesterase family